LVKARILIDGKLSARVDTGDVGPISGGDEAVIIQALRDCWPRADVVVVADYEKGLLTSKVIETIAQLQAADPKYLVVDAIDLLKYRQCCTTVVTPNHQQALRLIAMMGCPSWDRLKTVAHYQRSILHWSGAQYAAVTLDSEGSVLLGNGKPYFVPAKSIEAPSPSGAGDTFAAAFALFGLTRSPRKALRLAQRAAEVACSRPYTHATTLAELKSRKRVVLACGCFDILHEGHLALLKEAANLGDKLVVGINADESVRLLKGPSRPVNPSEVRLVNLYALDCIDEVRVFDEDTPAQLIERLRPDVYVKGGDYSVKTLPEAAIVQAYGGEVVIFPTVPGHSTTAIIEGLNAV
jgi:D-beta-D-heptose 7-phosphate kinase/D-beta-D-heptose 1-phosphate adenosyltransferase